MSHLEDLLCEYYEWQGYMEGACLSGFQVASQVLAR